MKTFKYLFALLIFLLISSYSFAQITSYPHSTTFASGFGDWNQSGTDDFDWTQTTSGTPSAGTGPQSSNGANSTTGYIFTETSSPRGTNETARIYCTFDLTGKTSASVTFYYHIYASSGYGPGTLRLKIYKGNSSSGGTMHYPWTVTTSHNGWQQATIDLDSYTGYSYVQLAFESITASSGDVWQCDNSIDEIEVTATGGGGGGGGGGDLVPILDQDFSSLTSGVAITTSTSGNPYQIDNSTNCNTTDTWIVSSADATGTSCSGCSGNRVRIDYGGSSCIQDNELIIKNISPTKDEVEISFNYGYDDYDSDDSFKAVLYDETDNAIEHTLINTTTDCDDCSYSQTKSVTAGNSYSLRFEYIAHWDYGLTIDNILIQEQGSALPIVLVSFEGEAIGNYVKLDWVVASQLNNDYYTIEKSLDAYNWEELAILPGAGNSNQEMSYTTYDENPIIGHNYYRLTQTDYDGQFETFRPIAVTLKGERKEIIKRTNLLGQPVNEFYQGIVIEIWDNGDIAKHYNRN